MGIPSPRNGLSLCAGAGGLDMGLQLAEPGFHTRCFVEWEEYPRNTIIAAQRAGYFEPAQIWDDVTTFDGRPWRGRIDTILAGYPCQPFSQAGQRKGEGDERHLWPDIARIIQEIRPPRWVFLENVAGHVSLGAETVLRALWDLDYTPAAGLFSAQETGATDERLRWFSVAYRPRPDMADPEGRAWPIHPRQGEARSQAADAGRRGGDLGNAQVDGRREGGGEHGVWRGRDAAAGAGRKMADTCQPRSQGRERPGSPDKRDGAPPHGSATECRRPWMAPPGPGQRAAWSAVLDLAPDLAPSVSLGCIKRTADQFAALVAQGHMAEAEAERIICRMAAGMAQRSRALRLLGNGVHPVAAAHAWRTLAAAHGRRRVDLEAASRGNRANRTADAALTPDQTPERTE